MAQAHASMNLMEQRGSGFARMRDTMLNHGLDAPLYAQQDGYFVVTFQGADGNYERLTLQEGAAGFITPAADIKAQLNNRQKKIIVQVQREGAVTSDWRRKRFDVGGGKFGPTFAKRCGEPIRIRQPILLPRMKTELIDLEAGSASTEENTWLRPAPLTLDPVNNAEFSPHERLLRQFLEFTRSHEDSPLND